MVETAIKRGDRTAISFWRYGNILPEDEADFIGLLHQDDPVDFSSPILL